MALWNRDRFEREARLLCRCLDETLGQQTILDDGCTVWLTDTTYALRNWKIEKISSNSSDVYMSHDNVSTSHQERAREEQISHGDLKELQSLEDDTILLDHGHLVETTSGDELSGEMTAQWQFSIVYSDTYQVPVLYFHVQDRSGSPYAREQILRWLQPNATTTTGETASPADNESSWEFVSQEQHPITGFPSYFLHPCRTSERMRLLKASVADSQASINFLWAWMSIILPSVNHPIPPGLYRRIHQKLQKGST